MGGGLIMTFLGIAKCLKLEVLFAVFVAYALLYQPVREIE